MCEECGMRTCPSGCPNAAPDEPICKCSKCGCGLFYGDEGYKIDEGIIWCEECMINAAFLVE